MKYLSIASLTTILIFGLFCSIQAQGQDIKLGTINGQVLDSETKSPLLGASVMVVGTKLGARLDLDGKYSIKNVPVGNYTLKFNLIGYEPLSKTDIIVRSKRITYANAELKMSAVETGDVTVTAGYFSKVEDQPTSAVNYSAEEIRRAPGSAGDVSRILMTLPSVAKINDQMNSLVVRGGSPMENAFFVDNIEIPNINHYPTQGSSGGPIGLLNVEFIEDANFSSGGFSAAHGDKLSSIMDLTFREGNREENDYQLEMNFAGFGALGEGPLFNKKGSWMLSVRRSFLDLLVDAIGTGVAPKYSDYQGKLAFDLSSSDKVTVLDILGIDAIEFTKDQSIEDGNIIYGSTNIVENAFGVNWRHLWGKNGYSNTSISHMMTRYKSDFYRTKNDDNLSGGESTEQSFYLRNVNHYRLNESNRLEFGFDAKHLGIDNNSFFAEYTDPFGKDTPAVIFDDDISGQKLSAFATYISKPFSKFTASLGLRADYFSLNENAHISPRLSLSYQLTPKTSINGSTGIYYQNLPLIAFSGSGDHTNLKDPVAYHYIVGINHLLTENTRLTLEVYDKEYDNFPLDPTQPSLFIVDELFYRYGFFFDHEILVDNGKANSKGVELIVQKKLAENVYGLVSGSYFRSRYQDYDGIWRDRVFDNRYVLSVEGGYKPNSKWEFSLRWIYAGGVPYTPFDEVSSQADSSGIFDQTRVNEVRHSDYHSLNIRFDRRFHFGGSNLICYVSVWNAYNRKNVASFYWNEIENKQDVSYQWSALPIFGLEYEF
ncbi:MAG: TonB-dependent receptor [candidate division Zixibacteria bacterium]|nr:TonB-dependent receptor [candidate division Zixibacteria bacterium]